MRYKIEEYVVAIVEASSSMSSDLYYRRYTVAPDLLERLTGVENGNWENQNDGLEDTFRSMGVQFQGRASVKFIPSASALYVTNTAHELDKIETIITPIGGGGNGASGFGFESSGNNLFGSGEADPFSDEVGDPFGNGIRRRVPRSGSNSFNALSSGLRSGDTAINKDNIDFFLNGRNTIGFASGFQTIKSDLPVWQSQIVSFSAEQELSIPLPKEAGKWKLELRAFDGKSRTSKDHKLITTIAPYTISFDNPSSLLEGDVYTPSVKVFREKSGEAEILKVQVIQTVGDKVTTLGKEISYKKDELAQSIQLAELTAHLNELVKIEARIEETTIETSVTIPVRKWGAPVLSQKSIAVKAGETKWLELDLAEGTTPEYLALSVTPGFEKFLSQLALEDTLLTTWCFSPLENMHPSGKLLAITAVLDYLHSKNIKQGETYDLLIKQAQWNVDELLSLAGEKGYWSASTTTSYPDTWTTVYSYIALQKWDKIQAVDKLAINKAGEWLKARFQKANINDLETRSLLQMALAYGGGADFSECNRLQRNSVRLTSAAQLFLAQAFILQDRHAIAQQMVDDVFTKPLNEWGSRYPIAKDQGFLLGLALAAVADLEKTPIEYQKLKQALLEYSSRNNSNDFIRASVVTGLAKIQNKLEAQEGVEAKGTGSVYLGERKIMDFDLADKEKSLFKLVEKDLGAETKLKIEFKGQSTIYLNAGLLGYSKDYKHTDPGTKDVERSGIYERRYYHPRQSYKGTTLNALGTSKATAVNVGDEIIVRFRVVNLSKHEQAIVTEPIPSGFNYVAGSFSGQHNGVSFDGNQLVVKFHSNINVRWCYYKLVATQTGSWRQQPTALIHLANQSEPRYGNATSIKVLVDGEKSPDVYTYNVKELAEIAQLQFNGKDYAASEKSIQKLLALSQNRYTKDIARMQLWIENEKDSPDSEKLIESFETLDALDPDLDVPFSVVRKVANAYVEIGEYERAYFVYNALVNGNFEQEAFVAVALEKQKRRFEAIEFMKTLWQNYPESDTLGTSYYLYAQNLFAAAENMKELIGEDPSLKDLTKQDVQKTSIEMLKSYLPYFPEHPSGDEATYTICSGLFELKKYEEMVKIAHSAVTTYPNSSLNNSFRYMTALGYFWQLKFDQAVTAAEVVAKGDSEDKDLATFITAQIYHAQGKVTQAKKWYASVKDKFPDANSSIDYFDQKKLKIDEVNQFDTNDEVKIKLTHRNVEDAKIVIYKVDLMQLYLKHKNLSEISSINLAGLNPDFTLDKKLVQKVATNDEVTEVRLPIKDDGAYLVICKGNYEYTSGLVLKTPLSVEVQELTGQSRVRVNVKEKTSGKFLNGVHVKVIGSADSKFQKGDTDLRGVWESAAVKGQVTVIARDQKGRYVFFRGETVFGSSLLPNSIDTPAPQSSLDYLDNVIGNQSRFNEANKLRQGEYLEKGKKSNFKVKELLKQKK